MFFGCSSLSDIKSLENWNVSNGTYFSWMFRGCSSLKDIKSLENWNISNGTYFEGMFRGCSSLKDIKSLEIGMCQMGLILHLCSMNAHHYQI